MNLHTIKKQKLLCEPLSDNAVKLARAIYNTYLENNEKLCMVIKIQTILKLLKLQECEDSLTYIKSLLEEINEPLLVKNLKLYGKIFPVRFVVFCKYKIKKDTLELEISEEFLHVEEEYMLDSFLK